MVTLHVQREPQHPTEAPPEQKRQTELTTSLHARLIRIVHLHLRAVLL